MRHHFAPAAILLLTAAFARAQSHLPPDLLSALEDWRVTSSDPNWELVYDQSPLPSGQFAARMLLGGGVVHSFRPQTENARFLLARYFINQAQDMLLVDSATLVNDRTIELPLGLVGGSDKVTVRFVQVIEGVPVEHASVNVLFDLSDWTLLSIDSMAIPGVLALTTPSTTALEAAAIAMAAFEAETGMEAAPEATVTLAICDHQTAVCKGALAWKVEVVNAGEEVHAAVGYCIAANGAPTIIERENRMHHAFPQQSGGALKVKAWVTDTGDCSDLGCVNPCCYIPDAPVTPGRMLVRLPFLRVTDSAVPPHTKVTDANGEFSFPNAVYPLTYVLEGPHVEVQNAAGAELSLTTSDLGTVILNPSPSEHDVAQANAFYLLGSMRKWVQRVNPMDHTMDSDGLGSPYVAQVNVRPRSVGPGCNGWYDGDGYLRFTRTDPGGLGTPYCRDNAAYSTFVWHEMGHWLNQRYGGQGDDNDTGFDEGIADVFALYNSNFHIVLSNWMTDGNGRDGEDVANQWCGDCESDLLSCGGNEHGQGKVIMGAFWKMRVRLGENLSDPELGGDLANALFLAWMNAFDQNRIHSIIQYQLMVLDDDDHDWTNGSPNQAAIALGFAKHGFPAFADPSLGEHVTTVICP